MASVNKTRNEEAMEMIAGSGKLPGIAQVMDAVKLHQETMTQKSAELLASITNRHVLKVVKELRKQNKES